MPRRKQETASRSSKQGSGAAKTRSKEKLALYIDHLLSDGNTRKQKKGQKRMKAESEMPLSEENMTTYLKEVIEKHASELSDGRAKRLLQIADECGALAIDFNDSLVELASSSLPSQAHEVLAKYLVQEIRQVSSESTANDDAEVGKTLLTYFHEMICNGVDSTKLWKLILRECPVVELPSLFKHLIRIGVEQFTATYMDNVFHLGLAFLLESKDSVDGLASLLRDEVERAKDQSASFFSSTELGSLLSLNTVLQRDPKGGCLSIQGFLSHVKQKIIGPTTGDNVYKSSIESIRSNVSRMIQAVTTALDNLLNSKSDSNPQSVLAWMAAVINANRCCAEKELKHRSHDAYLVTFTTVLCQLILSHRKPVKSVDFIHYRSSECRLNLEGESFLSGDTIPNGFGSLRPSGTQVAVAEELFFCCQRAVGVCFFPVLSRYCGMRYSLPAAFYDENSYNNCLRLLDEDTLRDESLHRLVAQLYVKQSEFLLRRMQPTHGHESSQVDNRNSSTENLLSQVPQFLLEDMKCWLSIVSEISESLYNIIEKVPGMENCFTLCIRLVQYAEFMKVSYSRTLAMSLETLNQLSSDERFKRRLTEEITPILPSLLSIYSKHADLKKKLTYFQKGDTAAEESWVAESLNTPLDEDHLVKTFHDQLNTRLYDAPLLQSHSFAGLIADAPEADTENVLNAELHYFKRTFPSSPSAAVFLVVDKERMDVMRCAMSGPAGTPYSRGLFVFDIFCPADYPSVPPRVKLMSTVDGAVFFGSHVENGEIFPASLQRNLGYGILGDWSITKVLHLLKNMMLTAMRETSQDSQKCTNERPRRLCQVRAQTVRDAMLEPLKKPPDGLEEEVGIYFATQHPALMKQLARWVQVCSQECKLTTNVKNLFDEVLTWTSAYV